MLLIYLLKLFKISRFIIIHPTHRTLGSAPVGAQCPSLPHYIHVGESLGYRDWLWYPGLSPMLLSIALPFAFHISVFSINSSYLPLCFIRLFFTVAVSAPHQQPLLLIPVLGLALW